MNRGAAVLLSLFFIVGGCKGLDFSPNAPTTLRCDGGTFDYWTNPLGALETPDPCMPVSDDEWQRLCIQALRQHLVDTCEV